MPSEPRRENEPVIGRPKLSPEQVRAAREAHEARQAAAPRKTDHWPVVFVLLCLTLIVILSLYVPRDTNETSRGAARGVISSATVPYEWPFKVPRGTLRCEHGSAVVFEVEGRVYALNGVAQNWASRYGYEDVLPLLRPHPEYSIGYVSVGPVISAGLDRCD